MDLFKPLEFRYFVSHDANVDVQCEISRLELPLSAHPDACTPPEETSSSTSPSSSSSTLISQKDEIFVTVYVSCNGEALHGVPISTYTPSTYDSERNCIVWNDLLTFPGIKYRDLALDARLVFTVWGIGKKALGGTTLNLFDDQGVLRMGKQKLKFWFGRELEEERGRRGGGVEAYEEGFIQEDYLFRIEKARERYTFNQVPQVEWLDRLSLPYTGRILSDLSTHPRSRWSRPFQSKQEQALMDHSFLVLNVPMFQHPVLFEEKAYAGVGGLPIGLSIVRPIAVVDEKGGIAGSKAAILNHSPGWDLCVVYDCEAEADNPIESKYRKLAHDKFRGTTDPNLKPNKEEREKIERIVASPSDHLRIEDKDLLWMFRLSLTDNRKALTKFLLSVDWSVDSEVAQVPSLLEQWKQKTTIDLSDALKLLGREKAFQHEVVRAFAVDTLHRASDDEILNYLLQLVQALRYESCFSSTTSGSTEEAAVATTTTAAPLIATSSSAAAGGEEGEESRSSFILANFLIERACSSLELANFLYWYLRVELEDSSSGDVFKAVFEEFGRTLREINPVLSDSLRKQDTYVTRIAGCQRKARDDKGRKDNKEEKLRKLLAEADVVLPPDTDYVPMPLDPRIQETLSTLSISSYKVIFKNGDDLRQDQLIIQMVSLMDSLLKRVNLDLKLRPYRILATGPRDGLMEFVSGSLAVSEVLNKHSSLHEYFRAHQPDATAPFGIKSEVIHTFVKSCAGYCVITYILGIGDRHLDNIMLLPEGNLFHIDFGFIFGNDPKPMPPPFRLAPQMVDAMGGEGHEHYHRFKRYCCQAYNCFRENANLILTLLSLMVDAGIKDLSADPQTVLLKVEEKFRLDLNTEQAEVFFVSLISESLNAILPEIMERFHKMRTAIR